MDGASYTIKENAFCIFIVWPDSFWQASFLSATPAHYFSELISFVNNSVNKIVFQVTIQISFLNF